MRAWRKTTIWLGLVGSVSLFSLSALAENGAPTPLPDISLPAIADEAAEPSFHDVVVHQAPAVDSAAAHGIAPINTLKKIERTWLRR